MIRPAVFLSDWSDLQQDYEALLRMPVADADAARVLARRMIEANMPYSEVEALHLAVTERHGTAGTGVASAIRAEILSAYDDAFAGYRQLEKKYRTELSARRREAESLSHTTGALAASRNNLRTELSIQGRLLAERSSELERLNEKLASQRDEMAGFLYAISHDLKAPMNTVMSVLTLFLAEHGDTGLDLRDIEDAIAIASRTGTMLDDLLNFSRALDAEPENEVVDLNALVSDIFSDLGRGQARAVDFSKDDLQSVTGSAFQLRLLFQNLIANGAKFCPDDRTPCVEIRNKGGRGLNYTAVAVVDNGIGIDAIHHNKIFKLFNRLHESSEFPGSGIGLSLCKRIVLNHRGQIHLHSAPDQGTTFTVVLPV